MDLTWKNAPLSLHTNTNQAARPVQTAFSTSLLNLNGQIWYIACRTSMEDRDPNWQEKEILKL